jgi:mono/diheme cytochrome c family protein
MSESTSKSGTETQREPKASWVPAPLWAVTILGILAYFGIAHFVNMGAAFDPNAYGKYNTFAEVDGAHPKVELPEWFTVGKQVYLKNCLSCHQASGLGQAPLFPPLAKSDWVNVDGHSRLIRIVLGGLIGPIKVNDVEFNNNMLAWKDLLSDKEIASVLSYIRNEWGNKGTPVTPEEVAKIRAETKGRGEQWTATELLAIPLK